MLRDRSRDFGGEGFVRITIGTPEQSALALLRELETASMRNVTLRRKTKETDVRLKLNLDGPGKSVIYGHPISSITCSNKSPATADSNLELLAQGDLDVDQHHTVEDVGIALGQAVKQALGSKRGILRSGYFLMPMDDCLAAAALDFSGRAPIAFVTGSSSAVKVGDFQTELLEDFFQAFAQSAAANVHLKLMYGRSSHHQVEAIFKAFAKSLRFLR